MDGIQKDHRGTFPQNFTARHDFSVFQRDFRRSPFLEGFKKILPAEGLQKNFPVFFIDGFFRDASDHFVEYLCFKKRKRPPAGFLSVNKTVMGQVCLVHAHTGQLQGSAIDPFVFMKLILQPLVFHELFRLIFHVLHELVEYRRKFFAAAVPMVRKSCPVIPFQRALKGMQAISQREISISVPDETLKNQQTNKAEEKLGQTNGKILKPIGKYSQQKGRWNKASNKIKNHSAFQL